MSLRSECVLVGTQPDVECSFVRLRASAGLGRRINKGAMWQEFALDVYPLLPEFERLWDVLPMDITDTTVSKRQWDSLAREWLGRRRTAFVFYVYYAGGVGWSSQG